MSVAARFNQVFSASLPMTHAISTAPSLTSRPGTDSRDLSIGQRFYRPELDVLRLFAFSVVFCYHIGGDLHSRAPAWIASIIADVLGAGACGVDLFFLLSAYLITELLLREKERTGILNLKAFYVRRIARIWPLYFFFIAIAVAMQWILPGQHLGGKYIAAYFLLAGNWMVALHGMPASVAVPLWSVSIEEQFYLLWPHVVRRVSRQRMVIVAIGILVICFLLRFIGLSLQVRTTILDFGTTTRIDGIAVGILLAAILNHRTLTLSAVTRVLLFSGGGVIWVAVHHFRFPPAGPAYPFFANLFGYPLIALGSSMAFIAVLGCTLKQHSLVYLGRISYGLYVYHFMSIVLVHLLLYPRTKHPTGFAAYVLISAALTFILAWASYVLLETPFLKWKERFAVVRSRPV